MAEITREEIERLDRVARQIKHAFMNDAEQRSLLAHALSEPERIAQAERRGAEAMRGKCVDVAHMLAKTIRAAGRGGVAEWTANNIAVALSHVTAPDAPDEVDRIEAARREGEAAGIERAARWAFDRAELLRARARTSDDATWRHKEQHAADQLEIADRTIRSLTPAPAEPSAPVAPQSRAELEAIREARIAAREEEVAKLREGLKDVLASLVATVSLLGRIPNARLAAPSNKMFEQMMLDYEATIERARARLQGQGGDDGKTV
jgi:hypothetical protein